MNMLGLAKRTGARILLSSTSEIYGDPKISPQTEEYWGNTNNIGIRSCYDEGKRIAETLMVEYNRQHNVDIRIARIFNTYGPFMDPNDGRVVSNFINQLINNTDITVYGDGSQTRSFCYISDMLEGLYKLMNCVECTKYDIHKPINIGNPEEIKITELVEQLQQMLPNSKSQVTYKDLPSDDPLQRKPDISKAMSILNWKPIVTRHIGLNATISYFSQLNK
jgi:UDP-glucuronate decarboxylase